MRVSTFVKFSSLGLLAVSTFWGTRMMLGQGTPARKQTGSSKIAPAARADGDVQPRITITDIPLEAADPKDLPVEPEEIDDFPPTFVASRTIRHFDVVAQGRHAHVTATMEIFDRRSDVGYLWYLRVMEGPRGERLLLDRPYAQQIFNIPQGKARPTFDEILDLEPGSYVVELSLIELPPKANLAMLNNPKFVESSRVFARTKSVVIAP